MVVAVRPTKTPSRDEKDVEEADTKVCRPVQVFAFARFKESVALASWRLEPMVVVARAPVPLPVNSVLAAMLPHPVPPRAAERIPFQLVVNV